MKISHPWLTTFRGINAPKSGPIKYENNAQTILKQLQNNFEKVQKSTFLTPKWAKYGCQYGQKCRFLGPFSLYEFYFWLVGTEKKIKIVPPHS